MTADTLPSAFVSGKRLQAKHEVMARYGATAAGGVNRQALSAEDVQALKQMIQWGQEIGLAASRDLAGNFFLRLDGQNNTCAPVLSGSHLDSQPTGGKYDGVYGVLATLEALQAIQASGQVPRRPIVLVAWMNEEGSRFAPGMAGSAAFAGARNLEDVRSAHDTDGITAGEALDWVRDQLPELPECPLGFDIFSYVEAHIEQGPILERENKPIGIVTGIQGKYTYRVTVTGTAAHAGTSLRAERRDALLATTAIIQALAQALHDDQDIVKFTVGRLNVEPNAPSVVAQKVVFSIDLRHPDTEKLHRLAALIPKICRSHATPCDVHIEQLSCAESTIFDPSIRTIIEQTANHLGISHRQLISAAGHDARYAAMMAPAGMIFIPCHLGITHNEKEFVTQHDMECGAKVLADTLFELANR